MAHDRRMTSAGASDAAPATSPGDRLSRHLAQVEAGSEVLLLDVPEEWLPSDLEASLTLRRGRSEQGLPETRFAAIVRRHHDLEPLDDAALSTALEVLRTALQPEGRLLVLFEGLESPPARWVRIVSELGFVVLHQGSGRAEGQEVALLVLRRDPHHIRSYRPGDEDEILDLFRRCFHHQRTPQRWAWSYRDNPWANLAISLAEAEPDDPRDDGNSDPPALATHYAGYGMPFWHHGRTFVALQIGDTMTDPEYRGVGRGTRSLLARTVRHFFARFLGRGFGFYYGFNTGPIQRFCRWFIGGMEVEPVSYRWRGPGGPSPVAGYRIRRVHRVGRRYDRFFARVAPHYGYLVLRDARYLDWRYLRCPDTDYHLYSVERWGRLIGWGVFKRGDNTVVWGDALFEPRHRRAAATLLQRAWEDLRHDGPEGTEAWFPQRPDWWHEELLTLGFESRPNPSKLGFMILPDAETEAPLDELYYSMGDGDLF